ncbi:MAG: OmpA family protein [Cyclobacteriaceae bacterium]
MRKLINLSLFLCLLFHLSMAQEDRTEKLDSTINTAYDETNPVVHPSGNLLFFTRSNHPDNVAGKKDPGDIWVSVKDGNGWAAAKRVHGPINNRFFNGVIGFSADGETMFLHHLYKEGKLQSRGVSASIRKGDSWGEPIPVPVKYFQNRSDHQSASMAAGNQVMVMSIESYGNYGAEDIYVTFRQADGQWTSPENLGSQINTRYQEYSPYLLPDNKTLVFASNGHDGFGSMDFFYSTRLDETWKNWSKPQNLGAEINSNGREAYYHLSPDGEYIYFMSTRNSEGYGDIRRMKLQQEDLPNQVEEGEPVFATEMPEDISPSESAEEVMEVAPVDSTIMISGMVVSETDNQPIDAKLTFMPNNGVDISGTVTDKTNGFYQVKLPHPDNYLVKIEAKGYLNAEENLLLAGKTGNTFSQNFILSPLEIGRTFRLDNVLFYRGTTDLVDSSYAELDIVIEMMQQNPGIEIELGGHTDNRGAAKANLKLSQERVDEVKQYLVKNGIDEGRISGKGYGSLKPIASNKSEETRKLNRRVEFTIVKNKE